MCIQYNGDVSGAVSHGGKILRFNDLNDLLEESWLNSKDLFENTEI